MSPVLLVGACYVQVLQIVRGSPRLIATSNPSLLGRKQVIHLFLEKTTLNEYSLVLCAHNSLCMTFVFPVPSFSHCVVWTVLILRAQVFLLL